MFLVFCGEDKNSPKGGGEDFQTFFDNRGDAEAYCVGYCVTRNCLNRWAHVFDVESKEVVFSC